MVRRRSWRWIAALILICLTAGCADGERPLEPGTFRFSSDLQPFTWSVTAREVSPGLDVMPGQEWSFAYELRADLRRHSERYGAFTHLILAAQGFPEHDARGFYQSGASTLAVSSNATATGVPVERFNGWPKLRLLHGRDGSPMEGVAELPLPAGGVAARHDFSGRLKVKLPPTAPRGHYRVRVMVFARVKGVANPVLLENYGDNSNTQDEQIFPLVAVGKPAAPRLPWVILTSLGQAGDDGDGPTVYRGQPGTLPREEQGEVMLCGRSGFVTELIIPPGAYPVRPRFPTIFPYAAMPPVEGGLEVFPAQVNHHLRLDRGAVSCSLKGPGQGKPIDMGRRRMTGAGFAGPELERGGFHLDLRQTGRYQIMLRGHIEDTQGRKLVGGGTYDVNVALPLTFSTSCKPGASFLVGSRYPPKVNVIPPFPAEVEIVVEFLPGSNPARKRRWVGKGKANRFGHYVTGDKPPMALDEPGEYRSRVTARYRDGAGRLWMGQQVSVGVVAPREPGALEIHGTRSFPYDYKVGKPYYGGVKRFAGRKPLTRGFMPFRPSPLPDIFAQYDPRDTLFISSSGFDESMVEPHITAAVKDKDLSARLLAANRMASVAPPPLLQPRRDSWLYLRDVTQVSADSAAWIPADAAHADELPLRSVGRGALHPFAFPAERAVEAYIYLGVIRPGFPVLTTAFQSEALGLYWLASPNPFGYHVNASPNGDLAGDVYRIMAGAVVRDLKTGKNYYDAYSAPIAVTPPEGAANGILPPGRRPIVRTRDRAHKIFLATDTHDALEVGEDMRFGGLVFPAIRAHVSWTVTKPSGEVVVFKSQASRLGGVHAGPLPTTEPGIYRIKTLVTHGELRGDVVGTRDGSWWHAVLPAQDLPLLKTPLAGRTTVEPRQTVKLPISWPASLRKVKLSYGVLMPGQVLDQGEASPAGQTWEYRFSPVQRAVQFPNIDVRNFGTGEWDLADTIVFQFFLQAEDGQGVKVYDALRIVLRGETLYNYEALMSGGGGHPGGVKR